MISIIRFVILMALIFQANNATYVNSAIKKDAGTVEKDAESVEKDIGKIKLSRTALVNMVNDQCSSSPPPNTPTSVGDDALAEDDNKYEQDAEKYADGSGWGKYDNNNDINNGAKQATAFCQCLYQVEREQPSYAKQQSLFNDCLNKADGNDASHWEKVAKQYADKYGSKVESDAADFVWPYLEEDDDCCCGGCPGTTQSSSSSSSSSDDNAAAADLSVRGVPGGDDSLMGNENMSNIATILTVSGSIVLVIVLLWFARFGLNKWKTKDYECIDDSNNNNSNHNNVASSPNPYQNNGYDDTWDDDDDQTYNFYKDQKPRKQKKMGFMSKFKGSDRILNCEVNKYSAV